ncbi:MAG: hypothetical protein HYR78_07535, partial [Nitrospirae bacterium]|nr:hypothetical protein [Nitrospirota bacterium]
MSLLHFYRKPALSETKKKNLLPILRQCVASDINDIETEHCFNIETTAPLTSEELNTLRWLLEETFEPENFGDRSFLAYISEDVIARSKATKQSQNIKIATPEPTLSDKTRLLRSTRNDNSLIIEVGPRMNFTTAWSTNAVSVCHACGLKKITRIERSRRYKLVRSQESGVGSQKTTSELQTPNSELNTFLSLVHDRMTECPYPKTLETFETGIKP